MGSLKGMRSEFKTFVSFAIGVLLATLCTAQNPNTTPVPIRCLNGRIVSPVYGSQHCLCNAGFTGYACDQPIPTTQPPIHCVNGVIQYPGTVWQRCVCNPGFKGTACEWAIRTTPAPIRCVNGVINFAGTVFQNCSCNPGFIGAACDLAIPTYPPSIRCVNGFINFPGNVWQYCVCDLGFTGAACDMPIPTIRCVNGVITGARTLGQYCVCNPGFTGAACDQDQPPPCIANGKTYQNGERFNIDCNFCLCQNGSKICTQRLCEDKPGTCPILPPDAVGLCEELCGSDYDCPGSQKCCSQGCGHSCYDPADMPLGQIIVCVFSSPRLIIVGVSIGALILVAVILAVVFVCKRRQRLNKQHSAAHAQRLPRDLRTGFSHGIYAILGDLDMKLPPYTSPKSPPPYDHLDYNRAGLVDGKGYFSQPPSYYTIPGYKTMSSLRKESVGVENVSVKSDNLKSQKDDE